MIKISDYLNHLYSEVIHARKLVDRQSIELAKIYSEHEYLKYFSVPRFTIPNVKLEIPIKIDAIDSNTKYNFKLNEKDFISYVNLKIKNINKDKKLTIKPISREQIRSSKLMSIFRKLEKKDSSTFKGIEENINKIELPVKLNPKDDNLNSRALNLILKEGIRNQFKPVSAVLNNIFIDPDTTKESDKNKQMVMLNVEMVEESIRIVKLKDKNGNEFEEIVF